MPPIPRSGRPAELLFPGASRDLAAPPSTRPQSPFRMAPRIDAALADRDLARFVPATTRLKDGTRESSLTAAFGEDRHALRALAGQIRRQTLGALDHHLAAFAQKAEAHGLHLHVAADAARARALILDLIAQATADLPPETPRRIVKAKSMVTEEIQLLDALLDAGHDALETDLGELVLQLDDDAPSHLVTPMIHKDREAAARALSRLGADPALAGDAPPLLPADPKTLTRHARHHLRAAFRDAHIGITGANFLVAETGEIVLCTNEGNGRLSALAGRAHIAVTGIEKVVPTLAQLGVFLELLARSATGQPLTVYTSFVSGPLHRAPDGGSGPLHRAPDDASAPLRRAPDDGSDTGPTRAGPTHAGPARAVHLVLVDNGRSKVLGQPTYREALACIRCGACLNACPVYRTIGGHAFGSVWPGPIGMVLTPLMRGREATPDLPFASTLCGACHEACPVDIDLPALLVAHRAEAYAQAPITQRVASRLARLVLGGRLRWRAASALARIAARHHLGPTHLWERAGRRLPEPSARFSARWKALQRRPKRRLR